MSEDVYDLLEECALELKMTKDALQEALQENKKLKDKVFDLEHLVYEYEWAMGI